MGCTTPWITRGRATTGMYLSTCSRTSSRVCTCLHEPRFKHAILCISRTLVTSIPKRNGNTRTGMWVPFSSRFHFSNIYDKETENDKYFIQKNLSVFCRINYCKITLNMKSYPKNESFWILYKVKLIIKINIKLINRIKNERTLQLGKQWIYIIFSMVLWIN